MTTTTTARACPVTGQPLRPDRYISPAAVTTLRGHLIRRDLDGTRTDLLPGLLTDLADAAVVGMYRFGTRNGTTRRPAETRMVVNPAAADHHRALTRLLLRHTRWVADTHNLERPTTWTGVGRLLHATADQIARHPHAQDIYPELLAALARARALIDRPPDTVYAGRCGAGDCDGQLYAAPGATVVPCPRCGHQWDVNARRAEMLDRVAGMLMPAADLARTLTALTGTELRVATVWQWKRRGHITPTGINVKGQPLYVVGNVLARMTAPRRTA